MNEFQQTAFNTIDAINKKDEAKFYEGIAKLSKIDVRPYLKSFPIKAER